MAAGAKTNSPNKILPFSAFEQGLSVIGARYNRLRCHPEYPWVPGTLCEAGKLEVSEQYLRACGALYEAGKLEVSEQRGGRGSGGKAAIIYIIAQYAVSQPSVVSTDHIDRGVQSEPRGFSFDCPAATIRIAKSCVDTKIVSAGKSHHDWRAFT